MMRKIQNAVISGTSIEIERGMLTFWLYLKYELGEQGFGGYKLDNPDKNYAAHFIKNIMNTVGVDQWDKLVGKTIRVDSDFSLVYRIGHIIENK